MAKKTSNIVTGIVEEVNNLEADQYPFLFDGEQIKSEVSDWLDELTRTADEVEDGMSGMYG